jgi:hypothetical protein
MSLQNAAAAVLGRFFRSVETMWQNKGLHLVLAFLDFHPSDFIVLSSSLSWQRTSGVPDAHWYTPVNNSVCKHPFRCG